MRSNVEDIAAFNQLLQSGRFSHAREALAADVEISTNGPLVNFFIAVGGNKNVTLPALQKGRFFFFANVGNSNNLVIKDASGATVTTLLPGDTALLLASDVEWAPLRALSTLAVFTNTINGLVPAPNSVTPGSLFLRDDGQWAQVQVTGIVDAFKFITDGVNTAVGSGPDTFYLRSSSGKIGITVTNNQVTFGDNANFTVNEAAVDHNLLLNYVANQHVDHSTISVLAGTGLSGGGTITASRTLNFNPNGLTVNASPLLTDYAVMDLAAGGPRRTLWSSINGILDHNSLLNYVANRHVDHSAVSMVASTGLTGGGDITTSRSFALDLNSLTADTLASGDFFVFYDISGGDHNKVTLANLTGSIDHNSLLNYVANQHVDHSSVSISTTEGVQGGGNITATRTLKLDINGLTVDATPDGTADYVVSYDASAGVHKKVLMQNIPAASNTPATATPLMDGTGAVGTATKYAREDHRHPTDTSRAPVATPAFTGDGTITGAWYIGFGATGATTTLLTINGGNTGTGGAWAQFTKAGGNAWSLGHYSTIMGTGTSSDFLVRATTGGNAFTISYNTGVVTFIQIPVSVTPSQNDNSTNVATTAYVDRTTHEKLSGNRTYYVLTTGSDSNTGLVNSAGGAFLTIQKAINVAYGLDFNGFIVTIQVGAGTYAGSITFTGPFLGTGATGYLQLTGDNTTPANVVLSGGLFCTNAAVASVGGFKMTSAVQAYSAGILNINNKMEYGSVGGGQHLNAYYNGAIQITAGYSITGNAGIHWLAKQGGRITCVGVTINFAAGLTFTLVAYVSQGAAVLEINGNTFTGTAPTGQRYQAEFAGGIVTGGAGVNYIPGSVAGVTNSPGWYQ